MWKQFLFWTIAGPKHLRRFLLLWLVLMGLCFYAFVQDTSSSVPAMRSHDGRALPTTVRR